MLAVALPVAASVRERLEAPFQAVETALSANDVGLVERSALGCVRRVVGQSRARESRAPWSLRREGEPSPPVPGSLEAQRPEQVAEARVLYERPGSEALV